MISQFRGQYRFLSNFYPSPIWVWEFDQVGLPPAPTVEHAYQALKSKDAFDWVSVLQEKSPGGAKRVGRTLPVRSNWNDRRIVVMRRLLVEKFAPGSELFHRLMKTRGEELVEGNTWGDTFWGVDTRRGGENQLGRLLMELRDTRWGHI